MEIITIMIIGVGLAVGFAVIALLAWKICRSKHEKVPATGAVNY